MKERNIGLLSTLACYILWGLLPLYWHILEDLDSIFILCNRIVWSAVFTIAILLITKKFSEVKAVFRDKKKMRFMIPAAIAITINWGVYIWAVNAGHLLDSSLGYYMNPLVVFAIGIALFIPAVREMVFKRFSVQIVSAAPFGGPRHDPGTITLEPGQYHRDPD